MPTRLPDKPKVKTIRAGDVRPAVPRTREKATVENVDWLLLWSLSIGFCAVILAGIAYFAGGDPGGASVILFGAAAIVALVLRGGAAPGDRR